MNKKITLGLVLIIVITIFFHFTRISTVEEKILSNIELDKVTMLKVDKFISISETISYELEKPDFNKLLSTLNDIELIKNWSGNSKNHISSPTLGETYKISFFNKEDIITIIFINDSRSLSVDRKVYYFRDKSNSKFDAFSNYLYEYALLSK